MASRWRRRDFVGLLGAAALLGLRARADAKESRERRLSFYNTHTEERLDTVYWQDGHYLDEGLKAIDWILRDHRTGEVAKMEHDLLNLLVALRLRLASDEPFHIVSGYRSPASNDYLRARDPDSGVAENSQHVKAKAADIRVPGRELLAVRAAAVELRGGGVGYYPASGFVHVDVARVRYW